jgi:hypothetical protein
MGVMSKLERLLKDTSTTVYEPYVSASQALEASKLKEVSGSVRIKA